MTSRAWPHPSASSLRFLPFLVASLAVLLVPAGCAHDEDGTSRSTVDWRRETAAATFAALEERLLAAEDLRVDYAIVSEGVLVSHLDGSLFLSDANNGVLEGRGDFGGTDYTLSVISANGRMEGETRAGTPEGPGPVKDSGFQDATPAAFREALVIGLTRMGLLHNLARLTANQPPDAGSGVVRNWVKVTDVSFESENVLAFGIQVDGEPVGKARLLLDPRRGLPLRREQEVRFPSGVMKVVETYTRVDA